MPGEAPWRLKAAEPPRKYAVCRDGNDLPPSRIAVQSPPPVLAAGLLFRGTIPVRRREIRSGFTASGYNNS